MSLIKQFGGPKGSSAALRVKMSHSDKSNKKSLPAIARAHGEEALNVCIELMRDERQPGQVRLAAAEKVISRGHGSTPQKIDIGLESRYQKFLDEGVPFEEWPSEPLMALALDQGTKLRGREMPPELFQAVQAALGMAAERAGVLIDQEAEEGHLLVEDLGQERGPGFEEKKLEW